VSQRAPPERVSATRGVLARPLLYEVERGAYDECRIDPKTLRGCWDGPRGTDVFAREFIRMNTTRHPEVRAEYVVMHFEIEGGKIRRANDFPVDLYEWEHFFTN